jgi:hypothetical protein
MSRPLPLLLLLLSLQLTTTTRVSISYKLTDDVILYHMKNTNIILVNDIVLLISKGIM